MKVSTRKCIYVILLFKNKQNKILQLKEFRQLIQFKSRTVILAQSYDWILHQFEIPGKTVVYINTSETLSIRGSRYGIFIQDDSEIKNLKEHSKECQGENSSYTSLTRSQHYHSIVYPCHGIKINTLLNMKEDHFSIDTINCFY